MEAQPTATVTATATTPGSRMSNPAKLVPELGAVAGALFKATGNGSVPRATIDLVQLRAGQIVGNTYLTVMHTQSLRAAGESEQRITAVASWQDAPCFTGAEAVALALVEAVLQPSPHGERVSDELYARAAAHYDETAIATLAIAIGQVNFFIPLALIGKPLPGVKPSEQWT
ncbi:carboxymuconolactone decarboxylase family protein [Streptomyces sp. CB01881]|uniref:carboxymuconolactone decarboxylase family protein n=1 Tax=Streptomyces sp. CB01881 TaxID=2078691 RepID=UPI000CDC6E01|nr:carboxymuconolactone decarboxylase family protein [Streptomyces sp. CB01881]AUY50377.1 carboxymuconolactone decarboxylase family protein [Streptomyces sp. CB01881]TYC73763.1 carboxymuconolactone decarboxylase family protein [Streptomyces sp. CB01881]